MASSLAATTLSCLLLLMSSSSTLSFTPTLGWTTTTSTRSTSTTQLYNWGPRIKNFVDEEFAREGGNRRAFESYELQERSDFLAKVRQDQQKFSKKRDDEFLEIARRAGVTDQSGDGVEPMGNFVDDDDEEDGFTDLGEDIDVSVRWDDE